jgi:predicted nucleic acid-binding protein
MQGVSVFFDTNVLVYAHDELSPFHENSALLLDLAIKKEITGIISEQNIMELYRILTNAIAMTGKPLSPSEAKSLIEETYLSGELKIVYPSKETMKKTLEIAGLKKLSSARIFDVRLYVQAQQSRPTYFATYNIEDFKNLGELTLKTPDEIV